MVFDEERSKPFEVCCDGREFSSPSTYFDDESELWQKFEAQCEGSWEDDISNDDGYSFAEEGGEEIDIPPIAGRLIDSFSLLTAAKKEHILEIVKQLIDREING